MLTKEIKESIDRSVLCWLATSSEGSPNVSPKEVFTYFGEKSIIIANIASPQTLRNIRRNNNVCISFIDVLVQKGFKIKGKAEIIKKTDARFHAMEKVLSKITEGKFPFSTITKITIGQAEKIIAPSYIFYPGTSEEEQIESAKKRYKI